MARSEVVREGSEEEASVARGRAEDPWCVRDFLGRIASESELSLHGDEGESELAARRRGRGLRLSPEQAQVQKKQRWRVAGVQLAAMLAGLLVV